MNQITLTQAISGATCAAIALYAKGANASGIAAASISFIAGKEIAKVNDIIAKTLSCIGIGIGTYFVTTKLCPQLSPSRALIVIGLGYAARMHKQFLTEKYHKSMSKDSQWCLKTAGESALLAGAALITVSGLKTLGLIK